MANKKSKAGNVRWLMSYTLRNEPRVIYVLAATVLLSLCRSVAELLITPSVLGLIETHAPLGKLLLTVGGFALALIVISSADAYFTSIAAYPKSHLRMNLMRQATVKTVTTSYINFISADYHRKLGQLIGRNFQGFPGIFMIWDAMYTLSKSLLGFGIYLILLTPVEPLLLMIVAAASAVGYFINQRANKHSLAMMDEEGELLGRLGYINDAARSSEFSKDIRIFGMRRWFEEVHERTLRAYRAFVMKRERAYVWASAADALLTLARNALAYAFLIGKVINGELTAAEFLLCFTAISGFTIWVNDIISGTVELRRHAQSIHSIRELLDYPEVYKFADGLPLEPRNDAKYELRLENVSFRYPDTDRDIIRNLDLTVRPGEKLAIVGLNGSGKSTLVRLMCGLCDPTQGRVLLDGKDIRQYDRRDIYRHYSVVFQHILALDATVAENVAQSIDNIDRSRVAECLARAGLSEKVASLPDGIDSNLGRNILRDGEVLSGGETQRLMLARAIYREAPIFILDEPTSALDPIAESDMYRQYDSMTDGRTAVYISHRLASTRFCDRVLLLSDGSVIEEGTHDELLALGGEYARLYIMQSRYYSDGGEPCEE